MTTAQTYAEAGDRWTLRAADRALLGNKTGATRLGFAVPLKLFQVEGRFPRRPEGVPAAAIEAVAGQVGVAAAAWRGYDWRGRAVEYHQAQIRAALCCCARPSEKRTSWYSPRRDARLLIWLGWSWAD